MPSAGPASASWNPKRGTTGLQPSSRLRMHRRVGSRAVALIDEMFKPLPRPRDIAVLPGPWAAPARHSESEFHLSRPSCRAPAPGPRAEWPLLTGCVAVRGLMMPLLPAPVPARHPSHSSPGGPALGLTPRA